MTSMTLTEPCLETCKLPPPLPGETIESPSKISRLGSVIKLLRLIGAALLVASASTFMLQQWDKGNDLVRYLTLLGHTSVLTAAGFFCGMKIKETRGARTFFGLVLVSIPVHFAVLGGLLYSQFSLDGNLGQVQHDLIWVADSPLQALGLSGLGLVLLTPMSMIAMATFARLEVKPLTLGYLAMNLALLVPVRNPDGAGLVLVLAFMAFCFFQRRLFWDKPLLRNLEGRFARFLLLVPIAVMVGRSLYLYDVSMLFNGILLLSMSMMAFMFMPKLEGKVSRLNLLQGMSAVGAIAGWGSVATDLISRLAIEEAMQIPLLALPVAAMLLLMSFQAKDMAPLYRRLAALVAVLPLSLNLFCFGGLWPSLLCLTSGLATLTYGLYIRQKLIVLAGGIGCVFGILYHTYNLIRIETLTHWAVLSLIGVSLILGASIFERRSESAIRTLASVRLKLSKWDY